jgi:hypothetical protein
MTPANPQELPHQSGRDQARFLKTARQVLETIGDEFFAVLANELCIALDAECVYIGEFTSRTSERVELIAASDKMDLPQMRKFLLRETPDGRIAEGCPGLFGSAVQKVFPEHHFLSHLHAEAYVGVPLFSPEGRVSGVIAAIFREPLGAEIYFVQSRE